MIMARTYDMSKRSKQASETRQNIIDAAEKLLTEKSLTDINLNAIATEAGITVQTVLRHMGSREGCLEAVAENVGKRIEDQRGNPNPKDISSSISELIEHYEAEGKLVLNLLAQEHSGDTFAAENTQKGREFHRNWVRQCFDSYSNDLNQDLEDAFVAATDIYIWKLLRLDLQRSSESVKIIITKMVKSLLEAT